MGAGMDSQNMITDSLMNRTPNDKARSHRGIAPMVIAPMVIAPMGLPVHRGSIIDVIRQLLPYTDRGISPRGTPF